MSASSAGPQTGRACFRPTSRGAAAPPRRWRRASHRLSRAGAKAALARLRRAGLPCRLSQDAGRYLCNASYFAALAAPMPVLFLHIPRPPRQRRRRPGAKPARLGWHERLAAAFADVAVDLLGAARRDS